MHGVSDIVLGCWRCSCKHNHVPAPRSQHSKGQRQVVNNTQIQVCQVIITAVKKNKTRDGTKIGGEGVLFYGGQGGLLEMVTFGQSLKTMREPARGTHLQEDQVQPPRGTGMFIVFEEERGSWGGLMEARRRVGDEVRGGKRAAAGYTFKG